MDRASSSHRIRPVTCSRGHALTRTTNLPTVYTGGDYICNTCGNNYKCSTTADYNCASCCFDICEPCHKVQQQILNVCDNGHKLYKVRNLFIFHSYASYKNNAYICNVCRGHYSAQAASSLHCPSCQFDMCPNCADDSHLVCREGHHLHKKSDLRSEGYSTNTYGCDGCSKSFSASAVPSHHCASCQYDLCDNCSKKTDLVCDNGHRLHQTRDLSHNPGYGSGRYICNVCRAKLEVSSHPTHHCAPCTYDLCPSCVSNSSIAKGKAQLGKGVDTVKNHISCPGQQLITTCPSRACKEKGNTKKYAWTCSGCNRALSLCADAYVSCQCVSSFVTNWRFDCGVHNAQFKLNVDDIAALYTAAVVTDMADTISQVEFRKKLKDNITAAFNKKKL